MYSERFHLLVYSLVYALVWHYCSLEMFWQKSAVILPYPTVIVPIRIILGSVVPKSRQWLFHDAYILYVQDEHNFHKLLFALSIFDKLLVSIITWSNIFYQCWRQHRHVRANMLCSVHCLNSPFWPNITLLLLNEFCYPVWYAW